MAASSANNSGMKTVKSDTNQRYSALFKTFYIELEPQRRHIPDVNSLRRGRVGSLHMFGLFWYGFILLVYAHCAEAPIESESSFLDTWLQLQDTVRCWVRRPDYPWTPR